MTLFKACLVFFIASTSVAENLITDEMSVETINPVTTEALTPVEFVDRENNLITQLQYESAVENFLKVYDNTQWFASSEAVPVSIGGKAKKKKDIKAAKKAEKKAMKVAKKTEKKAAKIAKKAEKKAKKVAKKAPGKGKKDRVPASKSKG